MPKPQFSFSEERNTVYYHSLRVYIFGADVTPWLTSNVVLNKAGRDGITGCTFSLSNVMRAFEITEQNVPPIGSGVFRNSDPYSPEGRYSEQAKHNIFVRKTRAANNTKTSIRTFGPIKANVTTSTSDTKKPVYGGVIKDIPNSASAQTDTYTTRYPMNVGSLVFHKYDPVRVFVKNPLSRSEDQWTCEFAGYIDTKSFHQNYLNGESMINVSCQDLRALMQNMRTQSNPMPQVGNQNTLAFGGTTGFIVKDTATAGFFNDLVAPFSTLSHVLGGKTFKDSIRYLMFGAFASKAGNSGVGTMSEGTTISYDPSSDKRKEVMEKWNNLVLFGNVDGTYLTQKQMIDMGTNTVPGGTNSPDAQKVHFLFPASGAPTNNLVSFSMVDGQIEARVEWVSRLELLNQICKGIDYQYYVTGMGDMVFEFPMYDFLPRDFNETYNSLYTFDKHLTSDTVNDEGGTPITALEVTSNSLVSEIANPTQSTATPSELKQTIFSNTLASRVGVHVETHFIPGVSNQDRLAQLGLMEFNKRMAQYDKMDSDVTYRPYIGVNRPIYNVVKAKMAIVESTSTTWAVADRGEVTLSVTLGYLRRLENGSFRFITGGEAVPISYSKLYDGIHMPGSGVNYDKKGSGKPVGADPDANVSN